jgi:hypothetical protein
MTVTEQIIEHVRELPVTMQSEILDFIEFLETKTEKRGKLKNEWFDFSLSQAMRDMVSEPSPYSLSDVKEKL